MQISSPRLQLSAWRPVALATLAACCLAAVPLGAQAQAVVMAGNYQNFDVLNSTGGETHGFEMEVWGVSAAQLTRIFPSNFYPSVIRYGFGTATDFPGGVYVRWIAPYDAATGTFTTATPVPPSLTTVPGDSCWTLGMPRTYYTAGCEHFGISTYYVNPTKILYRWLVADPANPGTVKPVGGDITIPAPIWVAMPPVAPGVAPVIEAAIEAPPPPPAKFGKAFWVKVFKTEQAGKVDLMDLVGDNHAVVPEAAAQVETSWSLLQSDPPSGGRQRKRGRLANRGGAGNGNHAVVRRYEYYKYAGALDPITNEALCADLTCLAPSAGELGDAIGAQNAAANLDVNSLTVNLTGSGAVSSADGVYSCGNKCYGVYAPGKTVAFTAKPAAGASLLAWGGACAGNAPTCTVTVNAESTVTATFSTVVVVGGGGGGGGGLSFTLSAGRSNPGTISSSPAGIDCGSSCSAKYAAGTLVTVTATPPAGQSFLGWSGACSGTNASCTVTINADTKVQASFSK